MTSLIKPSSLSKESSPESTPSFINSEKREPSCVSEAECSYFTSSSLQSRSFRSIPFATVGSAAPQHKFTFSAHWWFYLASRASRRSFVIGKDVCAKGITSWASSKKGGTSVPLQDQLLQRRSRQHVRFGHSSSRRIRHPVSFHLRWTAKKTQKHPHCWHVQFFNIVCFVLHIRTRSWSGAGATCVRQATATPHGGASLQDVSTAGRNVFPAGAGPAVAMT